MRAARRGCLRDAHAAGRLGSGGVGRVVGVKDRAEFAQVFSAEPG